MISEASDKIARSLNTEFARTITKPFAQAVREFGLIEPGDRIAVCVSGGKDSMLMALLFNDFKRHSGIPFDTVNLVMDPGYERENRLLIEKNAELLGIPITVFETDIFTSAEHARKSPCFLCSKMRRGHLYNKAKELGCGKIALGHHFDDIIESILMGMIYGGQVQTMMPKLDSKNFEGMRLIRPLYYIRAAEIERWRDLNDLSFLRCSCRFAGDSEDNGDSGASKRLEVRRLIARLAKDNPQIESNIFRSVQNVDLSRIISYKDETGVHSKIDGMSDRHGREKP